MPYLNATTDLIPRLPMIASGFLTPSSTPLTIDEVATIITLVSAELDGAAAAAGYLVPIPTSATQAYGQMQAFAEYGAGWKVLRTIYPGQGGAADKASVASEYRDAYQNALKLLMNGSLLLVGAPADTSGNARELPRSFDTSHPGDPRGGASPILAVNEVF